MPIGASAVIRGVGVGTGSRLGASDGRGSRHRERRPGHTAPRGLGSPGAPAFRPRRPCSPSAASSSSGAQAPAQVADRRRPGPRRAGVASDDPITSVLAISIDGLNPDALEQLGADGTPNLHELMADGASTLNARTEHELTITLPNHTGMVTGRRIEAATGGHGVTWNDDRRRPATVQAAAGQRVESVFTVRQRGRRHDRPLREQDEVLAVEAQLAGAASTPPASASTTPCSPGPCGATSSTTTARSASCTSRCPTSWATTAASCRRPTSAPSQRVDALVGEIVGAVRVRPGARRPAPRSSSPATTAAGAPTTPTPPSWPTTASPSWWPGPGVAAGADLYDLNADDYRDPGTRRTTYRAAAPAGPQRRPGQPRARPARPRRRPRQRAQLRARPRRLTPRPTYSPPGPTGPSRSTMTMPGTSRRASRSP